MTRKEEVENNIKVFSEGIKELNSLELMQEQVTNLNLSAIAQELADISITLAMIVDQLTSNNGSGTAESEDKEIIDKLGESKKFIEIINTGTESKPYYEIKYLDTVTNKTHIGYSSYSLEVISEYLRNDFEFDRVLVRK
jgi:hypothetical protein